MAIHPTLEHVTRRIQARSAPTRAAYLQRVDDASRAGPLRGALSCTNIAHGFAAAPAGDKIMLREQRRPNLAIVSSYNDMLSAHQPFEAFPAWIKQAAREAGAAAQFAGGVPAMCDGVTQGQDTLHASPDSKDNSRSRHNDISRSRGFQCTDEPAADRRRDVRQPRV